MLISKNKALLLQVTEIIKWLLVTYHCGNETEQDPIGTSQVQKPLRVPYCLFVQKGLSPRPSPSSNLDFGFLYHQMHVIVEGFPCEGQEGLSITSRRHGLLKSPMLCAVGRSLFKLGN